MNDDKTHLNNENPLYLPAGSVRAIIALVATIAIVLCVTLEIEVPVWFIGILATIIAYFFGNHTPIRST